MTDGRLNIRIIGRGRAGGAFAHALSDGATVELLGRGEHSRAATGADVVLLTVPDSEISTCACSIEPGDAVIAHVSGATALDALRPHARVASLHPLVSMPGPIEGARRLRGAWMAITGDPIIERVAALLDGRPFRVADDQRALYHATAAIAANHLVALMGQVERLAKLTDVPIDAFLELATGALDNVRASGAAASLTGPVTRQDWPTIRRHLAALPDAERPVYVALMQAAATLAGYELPADVTDRL